MAVIQIQAVKCRAFLNQVANNAISQGISLTSALTTVQSACFSNSFQKGRIVLSQSGSGQSGSFQMGQSGSEWSQDNVFGLTQQLIDLIQTVIQNGSFVYGMDDGTQTASLVQAMFNDDTMQGVSQQQGDWTGLNIPSIGGVMGY